jgi:hypothetical protein
MDVSSQLWVALFSETVPGQGGTIFKTLASSHLKVKGHLRRESYRCLFLHSDFGCYHVKVPLQGFSDSPFLSNLTLLLHP